jgi:MoxR-like ATPase
MAEVQSGRLADQAPDLADVQEFVDWTRAYRGPDHIAVRRAAEDDARQLLDELAGQMTHEDAQRLGRLLNTDGRAGEVRHDRFTPAFVGATLQKVTGDLDTFNRQVERLWDTDEQIALATLDEILKDPGAMPGAGRSLPSVLFYLRDRDRFVPWLRSTHRGLAALTGFKSQGRQGGAKTYLAYCEQARAFADTHGLASQEIDGVLAIAGAVFQQREQKSATSSSPPTLSEDAFTFLADLRADNTNEWMTENRSRYENSLRGPFKALMQAVAEQHIVDLDPALNTTIKTGEVLGSIRKRFPDEAGQYNTYFWGAFSRHRKQRDVQLYVRIDWNSLRVGAALGTAPKDAIERFRDGIKQGADVAWAVLEPVRDRLTFWLDDGPPPKEIRVTGPDDLLRWAEGASPTVLELFEPDDPLVTSKGLVDEVGLVLTTLYPIAALGWGEPLEESASTEEESDAESEEADYTLVQVAHDTHLPIEDLEEWVAMLASPRKRQAILYGPPGTSKTFVAKKLGQHLASPGGEVLTVQFHPSFSYEDFIEGLRPDESASELRYAVRPGIFTEFCDRARRKPSATFVFLIDEVNRADLGSVLGELMMLLEYRGERLPLPYSQRPFSIPKNVVVLATMNTADRSLALVDFALRRRFHTIEMAPSREILAEHLASTGEDGGLVLKFFDLLQKEVDSRDFAPGHAYWMGDDISADGLRRLWRYELRPYLAEYWFEHRSRLDSLEGSVGELLGEEA